MGNSIKFTDTGEVRVTAKAVNGRFNVSVTDTGPGISPERQTPIFEQFHQVDISSTKGTGLGLAIVKQIVEMHGGRIWVESTMGKGSTFQIGSRKRTRPMVLWRLALCARSGLAGVGWRPRAVPQSSA